MLLIFFFFDTLNSTQRSKFFIFNHYILLGAILPFYSMPAISHSRNSAALPRKTNSNMSLTLEPVYNFSYFALFTYVFSLFLEVSHGAAALTHFSLTHIAATLLTHCTAVVLTHSIAILIALPHWCSIYSGQSCRLFFS